MACGTLVVVSRSGALPEVAGDAGILMDPGDIAGLSSIMGRLVGDKDWREELSQKSHLRASQFTWEKAAHAVWQVIEDIK